MMVRSQGPSNYPELVYLRGGVAAAARQELQFDRALGLATTTLSLRLSNRYRL